ncbi:hypothetical protein QNO08_05060 [Arthrobacter sp. zg-Y820]|uniref:hypothetical protein n=1 Tax=unclassified Arthrobacter TaxID=235627 RepID=UPI001E2BD187|nr:MULTISPECIES: hypothetical protein [unclassified Arthrobacter]MCC9198083.1 hypothetical protein [Arthrobacter sp. zg-Y820]MDK1280950.1 hypothetical protein [Arthrobacter sp. zg.Y820]WIB10424.1 hypothetical protein QNO08_05060 [Arthrobacter sp. zg-Y820]
MAITDFGFFSGGTTSLALSLVLLYGTGAALIVVIAAVYRLVNKWALKRTETAPEDTAAVAFLGTTRSATEEVRSALRPPAATGRPHPAPVSPRTVRPAASVSASDTAATKPAAQKQPANGQNIAASAKPAPKKTVPTKSASNPAQGIRTQSKIPPAKTAQAKGRPANNAGSKSAPAERTDSSGDRVPGNKPGSAKDGSSGAGGPAAPAQQICNTANGARPALVLAASTALPQLPRQQHVLDGRQRAS